MPEPTELRIQPTPKSGPLNVDTLGKVVTLIVEISLGTGFLYDAFYFGTLDPRLPRLFVISDHIESTIAIMPFVIWGLLVSLMVPVIVEREHDLGCSAVARGVR